MSSRSLLRIEGNITARAAVYEKLHNAIINGYFKPGQRLLERDLAEELGVSRTPVREVIRQLERERLVECSPYRGVVVRQLSVGEAEEVYQVRFALEALAAELAAKRVTTEDLAGISKSLDDYERATEESDLVKATECNRDFHSRIAKAARQSLLAEILNYLQAHISLLSDVTMKTRQRTTLEEHKRIFEAVANEDPIRAREAMEAHIGALWDMAKERLK
ncbi:MAG: GntR family transcriptional regulator [Actinobacteria bacterium]|nr:GntR family transcriptional regulator [Actinomycetota bacterium]